MKILFAASETIPIIRATGGLRDTVKNVKLNNDLSGLNKRIKSLNFIKIKKFGEKSKLTP